MTDIIDPESPLGQAQLAQDQAGATAIAAAPALVVHPMVNAVVSGVYNNPAVPPQNAASVAAGVLSSLMPLLQPALAVSRASPMTGAEVAIGVSALEAILSMFFPHPRLS